jgi:hypothetical protein
MATKKAPVKKKVTAPKKKTTPKKATKKPGLLGPSPKYTSFHVSKDIRFMNMRVTRQTIYWSILLIFILIVQLWILNTQMDVLQTLNDITM